MGMQQVRMALHNLGGTGSPAGFKLRLSNCLQEELHRDRWAWLRPVAWGFALATAMAILFWPEPEAIFAPVEPKSALAEGPAWAIPVADRQLGRRWTERFPELSNAQLYAHMRPVSF